MKLPSVVHSLAEKLHIIVLSLCVILVVSSPWIIIGRRLRSNASFWDQLHVYLGTVAAILGLLFVIKCCLNGGWRQFFPWLTLDFSQLIADIKGFFQGKLPSSGGKGLFSFVEGFGLILLAGVCITGLLWLAFQGQTDAVTWRKYHLLFAQGFTGFIVVHCLFAVVHVIEMVRNS
ncbi:cytochrome b/b6 domain-containing protein [Shewanella maritima]|uniref:cytochrome b/b6 domain-containing protein n=1 Tax=Shewanella maritima TaxID=2520507 RepID=UPI003735F75D